MGCEETKKNYHKMQSETTIFLPANHPTYLRHSPPNNSATPADLWRRKPSHQLLRPMQTLSVVW